MFLDNGFIFSPSPRSAPYGNIMITIYDENFNTNFSQSLYDSIIDSISLYNIPCPFCSSHSWIHYGYYKRSIKTQGVLQPLIIRRLLCKHCERTHALLPSFIVPYSQIVFHDTLDIIKSSSPFDWEIILDRNPIIDISNIYYIIKSDIQRFKDVLVQLSDHSPLSIIQSCFSRYSCMFMQKKSTKNRFYLLPT